MFDRAEGSRRNFYAGFRRKFCRGCGIDFVEDLVEDLVGNLVEQSRVSRVEQSSRLNTNEDTTSAEVVKDLVEDVLRSEIT